MGATSITLGERSGQGSAKRIMRDTGIQEIADEFGIETLDFNLLSEPTDWVMVNPKGSHWKQGFAFSRRILDADAVVNVCCLKTHQYGGHFTMSIKNAVGMIASALRNRDTIFMDEMHSSGNIRKMIAEINTAYAPALIVMDGVDCFTSGGPAEGRLVASKVVLAGTDRIAIDAVGVAILRYFNTTSQVARGPIFQQEQIARAVELGLGIDTPYKIKLLTPDDESAAYAGEIKGILLNA
jgi:uncharacterized protein (DUF362 family)